MTVIDFLVWSLSGGFWRFAGVAILAMIIASGAAAAISAVTGA